jgi:hypothetical protein
VEFTVELRKLWPSFEDADVLKADTLSSKLENMAPMTDSPHALSCFSVLLSERFFFLKLIPGEIIT